MFFQSNKKKTLKIEYTEFIAGKNIIYEFSALNTPAQNGYSEQKKFILAMKAKAMHISARLLRYLWNELIKRARYIANHMLMQKHR